MELSIKAKAARNQYAQAYREKNKERLRENLKKFKKDHPEKIKEYNARYWEKKAKQQV